MELRRLEYFVALAKTQSFSEAAEELYTTQGNVSKQLAALEKELDTVLIQRSKRQCALTASGAALLPHAQKLLADFQELEVAVAAAKKNQENRVRISSIPVMAHYDITGYLSQFSHENPDISLSIQEMESIGIFAALEEGRCDFAFTRITKESPLALDSIAICTDSLAVVLSARHPLASRQELSLSELSQESFLQLDKNTCLYEPVQEACRKAGFEPSISYTGTRMENILELVANEMGISLMMKAAAEYISTDSIKIVPLKEKITSEISLVRLSNKKYSAACMKFWNYMLEESSLL